MILSKLFSFQKPKKAPESILVLGDSHVNVFEHELFAQAFPHKNFIICREWGATASGLENPNVKVKAYDRFLEAAQTERYRKVIICLGEVDTGFVLWYRVEKFGASLTVMLERTVSAYTRFLQKLAELCDTLIVYSAPLPTIEDGNDWGEVANLRKEIHASQVERTALTLRFNKLVEEHCQAQGWIYVSLDRESLGENGIVRDGLLNKNRRDHHYDKGQYAQLLTKKLKRVL